LTLQSMTGFARAEGTLEGQSWVWEFRSVNGKSMDMRLRMPSGFEAIEQQLRKAGQSRLSRGNIQVALTVERGAAPTSMQINQAGLDAVLSAIAHIDGNSNTSPSTAAQILSLRGVLEIGESAQSSEEISALQTAVFESFMKGLDDLIAHRGAEGAALNGILVQHLDEISRLTKSIEADPAHSPEAVHAKLQKQVVSLLRETAELNEDRLHQEAALLATKADIREELDRLKAHVEGARELLAQGSPVGRKLEFLAQEFNREANTLCSKSNAVSITEAGLDLKVVIDQFREQILNVE